MRGINLKNIYVIDLIEYKFEELSNYQKEYVNSISDRNKYNNLRNEILNNEGDDLCGTIKIYFPEQKMKVFDEFDILLKELP